MAYKLLFKTTLVNQKYHFWYKIIIILLVLMLVIIASAVMDDYLISDGLIPFLICLASGVSLIVFGVKKIEYNKTDFKFLKLQSGEVQLVIKNKKTLNTFSLPIKSRVVGFGERVSGAGGAMLISFEVGQIFLEIDLNGEKIYLQQTVYEIPQGTWLIEEELISHSDKVFNHYFFNKFSIPKLAGVFNKYQ